MGCLRKTAVILVGIVITGGEPTIHEEKLLEFIKKIKKLGLAVKLDSNGTNPEFLQKILKENLVDYLAMDIKAPFDSYNKIVGRAVNIKAIKKSVEIVKNSGVPHEFRTTIIKSLTSQEDILAIAKGIQGAEKYYLQKFVPTKILNPQLKRKVTYSDSDFEEFKKIVEPYVKSCEIR
jgi:pyruvate formate lyase activating enzyme